jgi:TAG lipase/lysophosphatidylethanolamine acyltransferase
MAHDLPNMKLLIRSGLLRNLGGIGDPSLYKKSLIGTKQVIEDYLDEVVTTLNVIHTSDIIGLQQKHDLFSEVSQSFGHTALMLHGGATFGLYHLGVVKALFEAGLLPRVISGSSVGALIAALICIHTKHELPNLFLPGGIDLAAFATKTTQGSIRRKITRLLTKGYLLDVKVLEDCVQANLGDITFEEAYKRTGMVLNITVSSSRVNEIPRVLNHLTSPNVLIRSAACASASMVGLYSAVDLLAKNNNGQIFVWSPSSIKWGYSYGDKESPEQRLAELFQVNHFILSQAQPYIASFLSRTATRSNLENSTLFTKILTFISSELRFRLSQLSRLGLISANVGSLFDSKVQGNVTIAPPLSSTDFYTIFGNPTYQSLSYWILKGQQSTWPYLAMIRNRIIIENKLYQGILSYYLVRQETLEQLSNLSKVKNELHPPKLLKRNQSIG